MRRTKCCLTNHLFLPMILRQRFWTFIFYSNCYWPPQISIIIVVALNCFVYFFLQHCLKASLLHCLLFSVVLQRVQDVPKLYTPLIYNTTNPKVFQFLMLHVIKIISPVLISKKDSLFENENAQILIICCLKKLINSISFT